MDVVFVLLSSYVKISLRYLYAKYTTFFWNFYYPVVLILSPQQEFRRVKPLKRKTYRVKMGYVLRFTKVSTPWSSEKAILLTPTAASPFFTFTLFQNFDRFGLHLDVGVVALDVQQNRLLDDVQPPHRAHNTLFCFDQAADFG